jgi:predicted RNase H-like nuclease (RuvC/YqgF family)
LEVSYIPKISAIATEAKAKDELLTNEFKARITRMNNLGENLYTLLTEESRRFNEGKEALQRTSNEIDDLKDAVNADLQPYNQKVRRETAANNRCVQHNEKARTYRQARAQLDAEMNGDLYGGGLWYGKYEQRIDVLNAQKTAVEQEAYTLRSVCSGITQRLEALTVTEKQIAARKREIAHMEQRWNSDKRAFDERVNAAEADLRWLEASQRPPE